MVIVINLQNFSSTEENIALVVGLVELLLQFLH